MASSTHEVDLVVVRDIRVTDTAQWMTPSKAKRFCDANPMWEIVDEMDHDYKYFSAVAGKKPKVLVKDENAFTKSGD